MHCCFAISKNVKNNFITMTTNFASNSNTNPSSCSFCISKKTLLKDKSYENSSPLRSIIFPRQLPSNILRTPWLFPQLPICIFNWKSTRRGTPQMILSILELAWGGGSPIICWTISLKSQRWKKSRFQSLFSVTMSLRVQSISRLELGTIFLHKGPMFGTQRSLVTALNVVFRTNHINPQSRRIRH